MASTTPNIGLTLPTGAEKVSRQVINDNNTIIDGKMGAVPSGQNLQGEIDALNSNITTLTNKSNGLGQTTTQSNSSFPSYSLNNCSGTIVNSFEWQQNTNDTLTIHGRLVVDNYVRTGSNPGITLTLPSSTKVKYGFIIKNDGYSAGATQGIRIGEHVNMKGDADSTTISVYVSESYTNFDTATRIWIVIPPITIAIKS